MSTVIDAPPPERVFCSQQQTDIAMLGSAERVDVWLLLEAPGPWPADAIGQGPLRADVKSWLTNTMAVIGAAGLTVRPQLIKQRRQISGAPRLLVGYANGLFQWQESQQRTLQSLDLLHCLREVQAGRECVLQPLQEPQFFVCTNGRRDLCCARYGLPIYRQLRALVGECAWEVSHLGGHRFAPNVLTLPDAVLYGRVQPRDCQALVQSCSRGQLYFDRLRGRSALPPVVQAAEGMLALNGLKLLHVRDDSDGTRVEFVGPEQRHAVCLKPADEPEMVLAGCDKTRLTPYYPFVRVG